MPSENEIIEETRSWLGTKWMHGQALKGYGADCVHFPIAVAKNLGQLPHEYKPIRYNKDWALHTDRSLLLEELKKVAIEVSIDKIQIGDFVALIYGKCPSHLAIYIGNGKIIHSVIRSGVIESNLSELQDKFHSVWRIS